MTISEDPACRIWPGFQAKETENRPLEGRTYVIESWRAGGDYSIMHEAERFIERKDNPYDDQVRARLTTILIEKRAEGCKWPLVTRELIEEAARAESLTSEVRADRFLQYMRTTINGDLLPVPLHKSDVVHSAFAHSESTTLEELSQLLKFLVLQGWIELTQTESPGHQPIFTVEGIKHLGTLDAPARRTLGFDTT